MLANIIHRWIPALYGLPAHRRPQAKKYWAFRFVKEHQSGRVLTYRARDAAKRDALGLLVLDRGKFSSPGGGSSAQATRMHLDHRGPPAACSQSAVGCI